jgi:hypothetical protein
MPRVGRLAQKAQAKEMRATGEQVTLLIQAGTTPSTTTPFNISVSDVSLDLATCTRVPIYANVKWHDLGTLAYGEGGRTINRKATIETTSQWTYYLKQTVAVQLEDGSILEKVGEGLSETKSLYTLEVAGKQNIAQ